MGALGSIIQSPATQMATQIAAPIALGAVRNKVKPLEKPIDAYFGLQKTLGTLSALNQTKDAFKSGMQQGNRYDNVLGTNTFPKKRNTWTMQKYSAFKMPGLRKDHRTLTQKEKEDKAKKRSKAIAIGVGTTLGAMCIASALSTGNALAPFESLIGGIKKIPSSTFNKAKNYNYGPVAGVAANGIDKAIRKTKVPDTGSLYKLRKNPNPINGMGNSMPKAVADSTNAILSGVAQGLALAAGTYGAQSIARNIKKNIDKSN